MSLRDRIAALPRYRWYVLGVLTAVYASSHVDRQIMGILLESIKNELGASDTQMGLPGLGQSPGDSGLLVVLLLIGGAENTA